jgi:SAM-dependent methyltransferase
VNAEEYVKMREAEDTYWWFVSRRRLAIRWLKEAAPAGKVLDVGCGPGALLADIQEDRDAYGLDFSPIAISLGTQRGLRNLVEGDAQDIPFPDGMFQAVVTLDTLEHVPDDRKALAEIHRILAPGGALILNVPAYMWLWGPHDVALHHCRRYTPTEVSARVEEAGFEVLRISSGVFVLFPVVVGIRLRDRVFRRGRASVSLPPVPGWLNHLLVLLMDWEGRMMSRVRWPWGSSVSVLARKKL